ncbi:DUF4838 domain-containing protein [Niabella sp. CC-SYL272]|uniref:DUF4838 domain-containing protein n=1 Tax=Niabella agricola TaxID=2891571 RepID=UPI001F30AC2F|nr:DUF4838 domain-containing protein [Niabella agricola]MCF3109874.1 DUF4838 domain-containing protein [Niabella agricola]
MVIKKWWSPLFCVAALLCGTGLYAQQDLTLVEAGRTAYRIYVAPTAPASVKDAARALQHYFKKVTGAVPAIINAAPRGERPFISLGQNTLAVAAGLNDKELIYDGFKIVTKEKNIFILGPDTNAGKVSYLGGSSNGTSNGVYTFIEDYLGVSWLQPGAAGEQFIPRSTLTIPPLQRSVSPVFNFRVVSQTIPGPTLTRWGMGLKQGRFAAVEHEHAWEQTIPAALFKTHPDWFAQANGKPVPPAGSYKLETTNPQLVQAFADVVIETFRKNPAQRWYAISPSDGVGWSESIASKALYETDPFGKTSLTTLVLKFYNDVAKIVRKEFPDRKLGGYIYAQYLYPPEKGIPPLEPNLSLVVAPSIGYGFQLYRPETRANWDRIIRAWGESSKKYGFDVYYFDLPTVLMQSLGILTPPAPEILNFIYPRLHRYGFKGVYMYGMAIWPVFGPLNHIMAKMEWDPQQDAAVLLTAYYQKAYGTAAAPHIAQLYAVLDTAFRRFYQAHPNAGYNLTPAHLKEIYAPAYLQLEAHYQNALHTPKDRLQQQRLRSFGNVLSLLQWHLKANGLMDTAYTSALTKNETGIDQLLAVQDPDQSLQLSAEDIRPEPPFTVQAVANPANQPGSVVPTYGRIRMLLYKTTTAPASVHINAISSNGEFVAYRLTSRNGQQVHTTGVIRAGKNIPVPTASKTPYLLDINNRGSYIQAQVQGAAFAYKTNAHGAGFRVCTSAIEGDSLSLFFYVPEKLRDFSITLGSSPGITARVYGADGQLSGVLNTGTASASRLEVVLTPQQMANPAARYWKVVLYKPAGPAVQIAALTLDARLPQWVTTSSSLLQFE